MGRKTDFQVQEAQRVPNKINSNGCTPRHTVIKMTKIKDKRESLKQKEKNSTNYMLYGIYGEHPYDFS